MNGFPPQRLLLGLLPLLALLQGCKMPLLQEYLGERSKSIGFGSTIRVLVETRLGADPLDIKLNKSTISAEIREFERFNPDVKIQARFIPLVDLEREIKFQHTRGLGPDLILLTNNNALPFLRKNFIKPVSLNQFEILSIRNSLLPSFKHKGKLIGTHGNICTFSLQAIKHITSVDGGLLFLPHEELNRRARLLRWYGIDRDSPRKDFRCEADIEEWGYKFHMNDVCATVGIENLKHFKEIVGKHRSNAKFYDKELQDIDGVTLLKREEDHNSAFWIYSMLVENRDGF